MEHIVTTMPSPTMPINVRIKMIVKIIDMTMPGAGILLTGDKIRPIAAIGTEILEL